MRVTRGPLEREKSSDSGGWITRCIFSGENSSGRYVTMMTIFILAPMIWLMSSRDSSSAKCKSSKQKHMNLWAVNTRSTSRNVFMSRIVLVEVPARRKSWDVEDATLGLATSGPGELPGDEPRRLRPLPRELVLWTEERGRDTNTEESGAPKRNSGRPRTL